MGGLASCLAFNAFECALCAGCSCVSSLLNFSFSKATRVGHLLIVLLTFTLAIILGTHFPNEIFKYESELGIKDLVEGCSSYYELFDPNCRYEMYVQLIYRASFALSTFFSLLAIISYFFEAVDKSMWLVKFGMAISTFIGFCYFKYDVIYQWAEAARYVSLLWLAVQGLLYLDFAHDIHDIFMAHAEDSMRERGSASGTYGFYIFLSLGLLVCCGVGLVMLFISSSSRTDITFAVITLVTGLLLTGISLLNTVKKGLLTPCLVFFYSAFLNSYASSFALGSTSVKVSNKALFLFLMLSVPSLILPLKTFNGQVITLFFLSADINGVNRCNYVTFCAFV